MNNSVGVSYKSYCYTYNNVDSITESNFSVLDLGTCQGKTTMLVKWACDYPSKVVYVTQSYEQLERFLTEYRKTGCKKKVVVLKGKNRVCRIESGLFHCSRCQYRRNKKVKPENNIYTPEVYPKNICPYYNLLREAREADIILTTFPELRELWKNNDLPYRPEETLLIIDEAEFILRMFFPQELKLFEINIVEPWEWTNIKKHYIIHLIDKILKYSPPKEWREILTLIIEKLNPKRVFTEQSANKVVRIIESFVDRILPWETVKKTIKHVFENTLNYETLHKAVYELQEELRAKAIKSEWLNPFDFEDFIDMLFRSRLINDAERRDLLELCWSLYSFKEFAINRKLRDPNTYEIWLIPFMVGINALHHFLPKHKQVILSSGSLTDHELTLLKINLNLVEIRRLNVEPYVSHEHCLVIVCDNYDPLALASSLARRNYIVYVTHASYEEANKFQNMLLKIKHVDSVIAESLKHIEKALKEKHVKVVHLPQCSKVSMNLRLQGDVAIVGPTYISKHVAFYKNKELLLKKCVLGETYQALSRILNAEKRPVALVMNKEVFEVLKSKLEQAKMKIKHVDNELEIIEEIEKWIPEPLGMKYSKEEKILPIKLRVKISKNIVKGHVYPIIKKQLPEKYKNLIGKEVEIIIAKVCTNSM